MSEIFSERTDELSRQLHCTMRDLAGKIGISQAMLFAYRSGKSEPTLKVLRKLEAAERAAGLQETPNVSGFPDSSAAKSEGKAKEFPAGEEKNPGVAGQLAAMESRLASLEGTLAALVGAMQLAARGWGMAKIDGGAAADFSGQAPSPLQSPPQAPSPKPQAPSPKPQAPSPKPQAPSPKKRRRENKAVTRGGLDTERANHDAGETYHHTWMDGIEIGEYYWKNPS